MKKIAFSLMFFIPISGFCQYFPQLREKADTIWINNVKYIPGDTLRLGNGSAPDGSYVFIMTLPKGLYLRSKYLDKKYSYLIYIGRENVAKKEGKVFFPIYITGDKKNKNKYIISYPQAIKTKELL